MKVWSLQVQQMLNLQSEKAGSGTPLEPVEKETGINENIISIQKDFHELVGKCLDPVANIPQI